MRQENRGNPSREALSEVFRRHEMAEEPIADFSPHISRYNFHILS